MKVLDILRDNTIIICPNILKEKIIEKISKLNKMYSYKIYSKSDLEKAFFFDCNYKTYLYLTKKENINYSIAKEYIEAMKYIENKEYKSEKLNKLAKLKEELIEQNLLQYNKKTTDIFKDKQIVVYGFDVIDKSLLNLLSRFEKYEIINDNYLKTNSKKVYRFNTLEEEVEGICYEISKLLDQNIDINKIKIANVNSEYYFTLQRYMKMYNIPFNSLNASSLFSYRCVKEFYENCIQTNDLKQSLLLFKEKYENETNIYKKLLNISNKFVGIEFNEVKHIFKDVLIEASLKENKNNVVEIIELDDQYFDNDEHVFVMSINQSIYPKSFKNDDFLSDGEKVELSLETSEEKNIIAKEKFKKLLEKSNNLFLSYKEKSPFSSYNKAFVLNECDIEETNYKKDFLISFSEEADQLKLAKIYDQIYKETNELEVSVLSSNYEIDYKKYNHSFKPFEKSKITNYMVDNNKSLSYSSINNYFECGFKYYLNNILNLGQEKTIRSAQIGSVYHKILELSNKKDFDFEKTFVEQTKDIKDVTTVFYLNKFKGALKDIIRLNQENLKDSQLTYQKNEQKVEITIQDAINITFKGFVDKILYTTKNNKTYVAIIDYKTGKTEIDLEKVKYGLSMQVPVYLYLLKNSNVFENVEFCGFYIQKLLPPIVSYENGYEKTIKEHIQLQGYSNSSKATLSLFDPHFYSSNLIKSMKENKDGSFNRFAKIMSSQEMNELAEIVKSKIEEGFKKICLCEFDISPKILQGKNQSCKYCEFKDCCYKTHDDNVYLDFSEEVEETEGEYSGY